MGKWLEQQEVKKEGKLLKRFRRENLGKFFFDLAKLSFAGLVVGGIVPLYAELSKLDNWYIILTGIITTFILAYIGNEILKS